MVWDQALMEEGDEDKEIMWLIMEIVSSFVWNELSLSRYGLTHLSQG